MDLESLKKLSLDEMVKLAIKSKDSKTLDLIAQTNCNYAKLFVARNHHTSGRTLERLSKADCVSVREAAISTAKKAYA